MGAGYAPLCVEVKPPTDVNDFHMERDELEELTDRDYTGDSFGR